MKHHKLTIRLNLITALEGFAIALSQQDMNDKLCLKILVGIIPLENMYRENEDKKKGQNMDHISVPVFKAVIYILIYNSSTFLIQ